jgi:hypothetical protein
MKSKKKSKKYLNKQIDDIDEGQAQNVLNEDAAPYAVGDKTEELEEPPNFDLTDEELKKLDEEDDDLTEEQWKELDEAIQEADRGETISEEEFIKAMAKWLPRSGTTKRS